MSVGAFVRLRVLFWLGTAVTLLWAPVHGASAVPPFRAYDGVTDLLFGTFAQWDSVWFVHIADHGYDSTQITAFFPLYPLFVHALSLVTGSTVVAGVLVSLASAAVAAWALGRLAHTLLPGRVADDAVLYVALYPIAYVFTALYSDALFLALAALAFLAAERRQALAAGAFGALAVGTRVMGLALVPALLVLLWPRDRSPRGLLRPAAVALLPAALGVYALYLHRHRHDAFAFVHAEHGPSWNRTHSSLGPLRGLWDATSAAWHGLLELARHLPRSQGYPDGLPLRDQWASWNVIQFALLVAALWLTVIAWRRFGHAYGLYSLATIAIFLSEPAQLVPLVSVPRFLLGDFPLFFALADVTSNRPRARQAVVVGFAAVGGVAAVAFAHKGWVA